MSNAAKTGIAIVILIIVVVIGLIWYNSTKSNSSTAVVPNVVTPVASVKPIASPTPVSQGPNLIGTGLSAVTDDSNSSLQTDAAALDAQMKGLSTDLSNVDAGLAPGTSIPVQQ